MAALILVTNDDGISSPGMWRLAEVLGRLGEVVVVSPAYDASGSSAALALKGAIPCRKVQGSARAYAIGGTPATCVWVGMSSLLDRKPDLVVSGINMGPNLGCDTLISGTVGAALFAGSRGVSALAVSTDLGSDPDWRAPVQAAVTAAEHLLDLGAPQPVVLNLNVPAGQRVVGGRLTSLSDFSHLDMVSIDMRYEGSDLQLVPDFRPRRPERMSMGTDLAAYADGHAALTLLEPRVPSLALLDRVAAIAAAMEEPEAREQAGA